MLIRPSSFPCWVRWCSHHRPLKLQRRIIGLIPSVVVRLVGIHQGDITSMRPACRHWALPAGDREHWFDRAAVYPDRPTSLLAISHFLNMRYLLMIESCRVFAFKSGKLRGLGGVVHFAHHHRATRVRRFFMMVVKRGTAPPGLPPPPRVESAADSIAHKLAPLFSAMQPLVIRPSFFG